MKVVKVITPAIKNQSVIEISEVSPPTKVSSIADLTNNRIMALYNEKNMKIDEYKPEVINAILELIFSFSTI